MSAYTSLSHKQVAEILKEYDLVDLTSFELLSGGSANTNYKVNSNSKTYVLTVCDEKSLEEAQILADLLQYLAQHNFATSIIIRNSNDQGLVHWNGKPVILKKYLHGQISNYFSHNTLQEIGSQLGLLHQIKAPEYLPDHFSYGLEYFHELETNAPESLFQEWLLQMKEYILEHISDELPKALIHGDLFDSNVIIDEKLSRPILMDFEEACYYYRMFDVGMAMVGLCTNDQRLGLEKAKHLLTGYGKVVKMTADEHYSLKAFIVYGAVATAFWRYRQFNIINPDPLMYNHYQEMKRIADHVKEIPQAQFNKVCLKTSNDLNVGNNQNEKKRL